MVGGHGTQTTGQSLSTPAGGGGSGRLPFTSGVSERRTSGVDRMVGGTFGSTPVADPVDDPTQAQQQQPIVYQWVEDVANPEVVQRLQGIQQVLKQIQGEGRCVQDEIRTQRRSLGTAPQEPPQWIREMAEDQVAMARGIYESRRSSFSARDRLQIVDSLSREYRENTRGSYLRAYEYRMFQGQPALVLFLRTW